MQFIQRYNNLIWIMIFGVCQFVFPLEASGQDNSIRASDFAAPRGYSRAFSPSPHNFRRAFASAGEPVRFGTSSERFELRDGDCDITDCAKSRARAEIQAVQQVKRPRIGKDIWYGWSFYNETVPAFTEKDSLRLVFGQWTIGGGQRSVLRFIQLGQDEGNFGRCDPSICSGPNTSKGDVVVQLDDIATFNNWDSAQNNGYVCRLFDLTEQRGKWVDITLNTNFSARDDGYLRVWINRKLVCEYNGPLVSRSSLRAGRGRALEHRRGIFSPWGKRWHDSRGDTPKPTLVVYYDGFRTGSTLAEVDAPFNNLR